MWIIVVLSLVGISLQQSCSPEQVLSQSGYVARDFVVDEGKETGYIAASRSANHRIYRWRFPQNELTLFYTEPGPISVMHFSPPNTLYYIISNKILRKLDVTQPNASTIVTFTDAVSSIVEKDGFIWALTGTYLSTKPALYAWNLTGNYLLNVANFSFADSPTFIVASNNDSVLYFAVREDSIFKSYIYKFQIDFGNLTVPSYSYIHNQSVDDMMVLSNGDVLFVAFDSYIVLSSDLQFKYSYQHFFQLLSAWEIKNTTWFALASLDGVVLVNTVSSPFQVVVELTQSGEASFVYAKLPKVYVVDSVSESTIVSAELVCSMIGAPTESSQISESSESMESSESSDSTQGTSDSTYSTDVPTSSIISSEVSSTFVTTTSSANDVCDITTPFRCRRGGCAASPVLCIEAECMSQTTPFHCYTSLLGHNFTCVTSPSICVAQTIASGFCSSGFICWDGSCVTSASECLSVPQCPSTLPIRCPDGSCATTLAACSPITCGQNRISCPDGRCQNATSECAPFEGGCSIQSPNQCGGYCGSNDCSCGTYGCSSFALEQDVLLVEQVFDPTLNFTLTLLSESGLEVLGYIFIPAFTFESTHSSQLVAIRVSSTPESLLFTTRAADFPSFDLSFIASPSIDIQILQGVASRNPFNPPVDIVLKVNPATTGREKCLAYIDSSLNWRCTPFPIRRSGSFVAGTTDHFTNFAVLLGDSATVEEEEEDDDTDGSDSTLGIAIGVSVGCAALLVILGMIGVIYYQRREKLAVQRALQLPS